MTNDDPGKHVLSPGTSSDGVVEIDNNNPGAPALGSGTLLTGGNFILTAAHVVCLTETSIIPAPAGDLSVTFRMPTGDVVIPAKQVWVDPGWDANPVDGNDLALIELADPAPAGAVGHAIYTGSNELFQTFSIYGYGESGTGDTGATLPAGTERWGENRWEATANQSPSKRPAALPGAPTFSSTISRVPTPISSAP